MNLRDAREGLEVRVGVDNPESLEIRWCHCQILSLKKVKRKPYRGASYKVPTMLFEVEVLDDEVHRGETFLVHPDVCTPWAEYHESWARREANTQLANKKEQALKTAITKLLGENAARKVEYRGFQSELIRIDEYTLAKILSLAEEGRQYLPTDFKWPAKNTFGIRPPALHRMDLPGADSTIHMYSEYSCEYFEPNLLRVQPGDTIRWINENGIHSIAFYSQERGEPQNISEGPKPWQSGLLTEPGSSVAYAFHEEGTYPYFCPLYGDMGMVGIIVVGDGKPELPSYLTDSHLPELTVLELLKIVQLSDTKTMHEVGITETAFSPAVLKVRRGDIIKWVNLGGGLDSVTTAYFTPSYHKIEGIPLTVSGWDSGAISLGSHCVYRISGHAPDGLYPYQCLGNHDGRRVGILALGEFEPLSNSFINTLSPAARNAIKAYQSQLERDAQSQ